MNQRHHTGFAVTAAGAVLWRRRSGAGARPDPAATEIALVHRPRYDDWSLPKGKVEPDETDPAAAAREVNEETGFVARLGARIGETRYQVLEGNKVVRYWSAEAVAGQFVPNREVDKLRWVPPEAAAELLTHAHDSAVVSRFRELTPPGRILLLVRHAKAGDRETWDGDDDLRPLTKKGERQALQLAELLPLFGPARAYAAPPVRCPQTIQPLADRLGLPIQSEPLLGEHDYWEEPDAGVARLRQLADYPDVAVVCSQGGVIPDVVEQLTGIPDPESRKGSMWVLGFSGARVVSADYYDKP